MSESAAVKSGDDSIVSCVEEMRPFCQWEGHLNLRFVRCQF